MTPDSRQPVGDDIFAVYRGSTPTTARPLNAVVEATEETEPWVKHTVAFDAAYGGERMRAYLFLPKSGSAAVPDGHLLSGRETPFVLRSSRDMSLRRGEFIIRQRTGVPLPGVQRHVRAVGAATRSDRTQNASSALRGREISDAPSTISRRDRTSIGTRLAFYGVSAGADAGVILTALEPRLKTSVLQGTGIVARRRRRRSTRSTTRRASASRR